ncbi:MAG: hypothetical protein M3082_06975 [Candidatus Dormibacteraeota bacterium]|nr:hypothetical protein [Candidatus Dormibacteraeota bacterium]
MGLALALFTLGYILGVWTACLVSEQPQVAYEEGGPWRTAEAVPVRAAEMRL